MRPQAKNIIIDSFLALLSEMPPSQIDVGDIAARAGVSRQAFYYNFKNRAALIEHIFAENEQIACRAFAASGELYDYLRTLLAQIAARPQLYRLPSAAAQCGDSLKRGLNTCMEQMQSGPRGRMNEQQWSALQFFGFGAAGMLKNWLEGGFRQSPEQLARIILDSAPRQLSEYLD